MNINHILKTSEYKWELIGNMVVFEKEVWVQNIKDILDLHGVKYTWCYEHGKCVFRLML